MTKGKDNFHTGSLSHAVINASYGFECVLKSTPERSSNLLLASAEPGSAGDILNGIVVFVNGV